MAAHEGSSIELQRDCEATLIPEGNQVNLLRGDHVVVTQALGGSFTVMTESGSLARIGAQDADALGQKDGQIHPGPGERREFDRSQVIDELKTIFDPEIPVNIVDLGLIYVCEVYGVADGNHRVEVKMSMTAPGCGMGDVLRQEALAKVQAIPGVSEVDIEIVWDPPWDPNRMSDAARLQLGRF